MVLTQGFSQKQKQNKAKTQNLIDSARLGSQWESGTYQSLSLPVQRLWVVWPAVCVGSGIQIQALCLHGRHYSTVSAISLVLTSVFNILQIPDSSFQVFRHAVYGFVLKTWHFVFEPSVLLDLCLSLISCLWTLSSCFPSILSILFVLATSIKSQFSGLERQLSS